MTPQGSNTGSPAAGLDLEAVERRRKATTDCLWVKCCQSKRGGDWWTIHRGVEIDGVITALPGRQLFRVMSSGQQGGNDAAFVAHAREDIDALMAEVRRLRAALASPSPVPAAGLDPNWTADREAPPAGINRDLWRSLHDLCRIVRSTSGESILSHLTAYLAGCYDDFGLKVNLAYQPSCSGLATPIDEDLRPFGYAPGGYGGHCADCKQPFVSDKRAYRCRRCAVAAWEKNRATLSTPVAKESLTTAVPAAGPCYRCGDTGYLASDRFRMPCPEGCKPPALAAPVPTSTDAPVIPEDYDARCRSCGWRMGDHSSDGEYDICPNEPPEKLWEAIREAVDKLPGEIGESITSEAKDLSGAIGTLVDYAGRMRNEAEGLGDILQQKQEKEEWAAQPGSASTGPAVTKPPLTGKWRYNNGVLCCGTLRVMRDDWDTAPADEFRAEVMGWACRVLNEEIERYQAGEGREAAKGAHWDFCVKTIDASKPCNCLPPYARVGSEEGEKEGAGLDPKLVKLVCAYFSALNLIGQLRKLAVSDGRYWDRFGACIFCSNHMDKGHVEGRLIVESQKALLRYDEEQRRVSAPLPLQRAGDGQIREAFYTAFSLGWDAAIAAQGPGYKESFKHLRGVKGVDACWKEFQASEAKPAEASDAEQSSPVTPVLPVSQAPEGGAE